MPLGDYTIIAKVGQGAQGIVYQVRHKNTGELYAMKCIDVSGLSEKERNAVLQEVRVLATLQQTPHSYVMGYLESFVDLDEGRLCIILEWSSEGTLQDRFEEHERLEKERKKSSNTDSSTTAPLPPPLTENEVWKIFLSVVIALNHIHAMHILHRDVKMANLFLHSANATTDFIALRSGDVCSGTKNGLAPKNRRKVLIDRVQLGDFGVSTILSDRSNALTMVGTPYYLSPEICMGRPYSDKSDVWSLGIMLYCMLHCKMPFEASNYGALVLCIIQQNTIALGANPYSSILSKLCTWLLQKNETSRPSAREVIFHPACLSKAIDLGLEIPQELLADREAILNVIGPLRCTRCRLPPNYKAAKYNGLQPALICAGTEVSSSAPSSRSTVVAHPHTVGDPSEARPLPLRRIQIKGCAPKKERRVTGNVVTGVISLHPTIAGEHPQSLHASGCGRLAARVVVQRLSRGKGIVRGPCNVPASQDANDNKASASQPTLRASKADIDSVRSLPDHAGVNAISSEESESDEPQRYVLSKPARFPNHTGAIISPAAIPVHDVVDRYLAQLGMLGSVLVGEDEPSSDLDNKEDNKDNHYAYSTIQFNNNVNLDEDVNSVVVSSVLGGSVRWRVGDESGVADSVISDNEHQFIMKNAIISTAMGESRYPVATDDTIPVTQTLHMPIPLSRLIPQGSCEAWPRQHRRSNVILEDDPAYCGMPFSTAFPSGKEFSSTYNPATTTLVHTLDKREVNALIDEVLNNAEELVETTVFRELIELFLKDSRACGNISFTSSAVPVQPTSPAPSALPSSELQQFMTDRGITDAHIQAVLIHLSFRYLFLRGQQLRLDEKTPE